MAPPRALCRCWVLNPGTHHSAASTLTYHAVSQAPVLPFSKVCEVEFKYHVLYLFKVHNSMAFHIFAGLCHHQSPLSVLELFCSTKMKLRPLSQQCPASHPSTHSAFCIWISHTVYVMHTLPWCLADLTERGVFKHHPCCPWFQFIFMTEC